MKESYLLALQLHEAAVRQGAPPDRCHLCGAAVAEGLKGCFELFAALSAGSVQPDPGGATFYGVDAHALQHPEIHGKKNNAAHLLRLHWVLRRGEDGRAGEVPRWWQQYTSRADVPRLEPPPALARGQMTVANVAQATSAQDYLARARRWAASVYDAWGAHHAWAEREFERVLPQQRSAPGKRERRAQAGGR